MATEPASVPALNLVLAIHRLLRVLRSALPPGGFNSTQLLILSQLAGGDPIRIGELAQRVHCSQPTATTVVNGLAATGLVSRIKDTEDGRAIKVSLTEAGLGALRDVGRQEAAYLDILMNELPEDERATVLAAVPIMLRMTDNSAGAEFGGISAAAARADTWRRSMTSGS
ncbi:MAG TPA: MarR family transcriptional regulator [Pseudonocardiaceae bacterium]|jgi:DNA-binding MarR family transcriptional regulator